ncbi:MAG: MFS transporter, partial [Alphaproteobacteria bacterium]|nr:MFS transporter [Alphaproteobacteria bacterium]
AGPVEMALRVMDWRGLFLVLAGLCVVVALALLVLVRDAPIGTKKGDHGGLLRGLGSILSSRWLWRIAPLVMTSQGTFMAVAGLWIGPWLRDVAGLEREEATSIVTACSAGMGIGFLFMGTLAERLARRGMSTLVVAGAGMLGFMGVQAVLVFGLPLAPLPVWVLFGLLGSSGVLGYAVLTQGFPATFAGRANTAINMFIFLTAFAVQYGFGLIVRQWPSGVEVYGAEGYRTALGLALAAQALAFGWYCVPARPDSRVAPGGRACDEG